MTSKTLLAFGVAGALACGASTAATYVCTKDPLDVSSLSCAKAPRDDRAYGPAAEQPVVPSSASVAYSRMVAGARQDSPSTQTASAFRPAPPPSLAGYNPVRADGDGA
jgi:hypothetical protein